MAFSGAVGTAAKLRHWTACACLLTCCWDCVAFRDEGVTVEPGDDVVLPCRDPRGGAVQGSEWRRPERGGEAVFWLNGRWLYHHLSFKGRVDLRDPEVRDGDVSVVLKNVDLSDAGTYECHVKVDQGFELVSSIRLRVAAPPRLRVRPGTDVTLSCHDPEAADIDLFKWKKLNPEQNVFIWQNQESDYDYEDELDRAFHGRVELKEPTMQNGDVSVVLKNVSANDSGTYECHIRDGSMLTHQLISTVVLEVDDSGGSEPGLCPNQSVSE
ncbi:V-set and immunoglobulin domain-containing protein 8-like isoform X2 [Betta splendens]|uniref:V-set and immunoglobulin domain-containing protein 8-like isoform X2 n=1 Tax=Betta splendens TaxID=158456 RepID=UPI00244DAC7B|nr:V-set and immunoglobulin domain-containing protein 8-like isoform X2 [Betta splendens]